MSALLWVLIIVAVLHAVALICAYYGNRPFAQRARAAAGLDMAYTLALGAWAVWLLANRGG